MAANLSAKSKEPQIVIIGETHPMWMMDICLMNSTAFLLLNKKAAKEEVGTLIKSAFLPLAFIKATCDKKMEYLRAYSGGTILVENPVVRAKGLAEVENIEAYKKLFDILSPTFGMKYERIVTEAIDTQIEVAKLTKRYKSLEFKIVTRIDLAVTQKGGKRFANFMGALRELSTNLKLLNEAKKAAKKGRKILIICGSAHARKYADALRKFGYSSEVILLDEPFREEIEKNIDGLFEIAYKYGVSKEIIKVSPSLRKG